MTTPENGPADRPAWGRPPAGGWGEQPDAGAETRSWSEQGAPVEQPDGATTRIDRPDPAATRLEQPGAWSGPPNPAPWTPQPGGPQQGGQQWGPPQAPAWAQQPPPGGGWGPPPQQYPPAPGGGQPQWGPPGYPPLPGPPQGQRRRSRVPFVVVGVVVLAVAVVLFLGLVTPGFFYSTVFDRTQLQAGVQRVLTDSYQITGVGEVTCGDPADGPITVRVDDTFTCTTLIDGAPATIPVRITSDDGGYEVSRPT